MPQILSSMGFTSGQQPEWQFGCIKRNFRWLFSIPTICASGIFSLPPSRVSRPSLSFKTMEAQHLNESIHFPAKPEWKPIQLKLYDIMKYDVGGAPLVNPIFNWLQRVYDSTPVTCGTWNPALGDTSDQASMPGIKAAYATLAMLDGCGGLIEQWQFEHVWPESVDFGELDYADSGIVMCDVTLRYDRAYIVDSRFVNEGLAGWGLTPTDIAFPTETIDSCPSVSATTINVPAAPYCANQSVTPSFASPPSASPSDIPFWQQSQGLAASSLAVSPPRRFSVRK